MVQFYAVSIVKMMSDGLQQIHAGNSEELQNKKETLGGWN